MKPNPTRPRRADFSPQDRRPRAWSDPREISSSYNNTPAPTEAATSTTISSNSSTSAKNHTSPENIQVNFNNKQTPKTGPRNESIAISNQGQPFPRRSVSFQNTASEPLPENKSQAGLSSKFAKNQSTYKHLKAKHLK